MELMDGGPNLPATEAGDPNTVRALRCSSSITIKPSVRVGRLHSLGLGLQEGQLYRCASRDLFGVSKTVSPIMPVLPCSSPGRLVPAPDSTGLKRNRRRVHHRDPTR